MTIPVWPDDLPSYVLVSGFQTGIRGTRLSTAMDAGPPKQRARGPKTRSIACGIYADRNQIARFDRFWEEEVNWGTLPFLAPDRVLDGLAVLDDLGVCLLDESGVPIFSEEWQLVQFGQTEPASTPVPDNPLLFVIQFDLVVLP